MSMLLVHALHETRDRILLLKKHLLEARQRELPEYTSFLDHNIELLEQALERAKIPEHYRVAIIGRFEIGKSAIAKRQLKHMT